MENGKNLITMNFKQFTWTITTSKNTSDEVEVTITATNYRAAYISKSGNISITVSTYSKYIYTK